MDGTRMARKKIYENNGFSIWQGPRVRDFGDKDVNSVDQVFYIETDGQCRYAKDDIIQAMRYIYLNMVYEGERERFRNLLRKEFDL